jgi:small subunit ribosomal protein S7
MAKRKKKDGRSRSERKMARRRIPPGRGVFPDLKFNSLLISKFINCMMWDGKRSIAESIVYRALGIIGEKMEGQDPVEIFTKAVENVKPALEVKSRRVGGANYQVPIEVKPERRQALSFRWLIGHAAPATSARWPRPPGRRAHATPTTRAATPSRSAKTPTSMAEANKAFAHYRW